MRAYAHRTFVIQGGGASCFVVRVLTLDPARLESVPASWSSVAVRRVPEGACCEVIASPEASRLASREGLRVLLIGSKTERPFGI